MYRCRRFVGRGDRVFSGDQVDGLCRSLPLEIRSMRLSGDLGREYSAKCELLLDMTLGIWWGFDPMADWIAFDVPQADFVQSAMVCMLKFVDRFEPSLSSWRTQGRWMRKELRRDMERANRRTAPSAESLESMVRGNWEGIYSEEPETEAPRARIVGRRIRGYMMGREALQRELDAILAPAVVEAEAQLDLFAMA